ncbi:MAG: efflux RND transporter periplasmic adaptor subunit [Gammaproteobacteria bacterium]|nr:efflux RND transporter periplasmic adaptor subunit [Gammaproteobacteria bacterium]
MHKIKKTIRRNTLLSLLCWSLMPTTAVVSAADKPLNITTSTLAEIAIYPTLSAPANVISLAESTLGAEISAPIKELPVNVGQAVHKGDVLVRMQCTDYVIATKRAKAGLQRLRSEQTLAKQQHQRVQRLVEQGSIAQEIMDQRSAEVATVNAQIDEQSATLQSARHNVKKCHVKAPFNGILTQRHISVGEITSPGLALVTLVDTNNIEIVANLRSDHIQRLQQAKFISFKTAARNYPLLLRTIVPVADKKTRDFSARLITTENKPAVGLAGRIEWQHAVAHLPTQYLLSRNNQLGFMSVKNNKAQFIPLVTAQEGRVAALQDIPLSTIIITNQLSNLSNSDSVQVTKK